MPKIELKSLDKFKANDYKIKIEKKIIEEKLKEISNQNKQFEDKKEDEKAIKGDQIIFDYSATADGVKFDGSEGKGVQIELGKDLFLKGFDEQLIGIKKEIKNLLMLFCLRTIRKKSWQIKKQYLNVQFQILKNQLRIKLMINLLK